ncbi:20650_t:CDS:2 [Gigaspora margarita]|uniref:20650_t:CDS:1 n=1 Tax=Gigaspora margarita TaxID=4874 RepID=A0ABN7UDP6_GIGMA|nr:20650_t:CDS:2 [Gigaspora margarita]
MALELMNTNIHNRALLHLQSILGKHGRRLEKFSHMPVLIAFSNNEHDNQLIIEHVIEAEIITRKHAGVHAFLPCITLSPSNVSLPFTFKHRQFPIQPAFAMNINKSQEQTLNWVSLYLPTPVFSHGQLYVALSRVTSKKNLKTLISKRQKMNTSRLDHTCNIVTRKSMYIRATEFIQDPE